MTKMKFQGLIAAPFTPLDGDGNLNLSMISALAGSLRQNKVSGAFILGSTGEGVSLSSAEKKRVIDAWMPEQDEHFKIIVLINANSGVEGRELAAYARERGAYGLALLPPFYYKIRNARHLVDCLREVTDGITDLPLYYYHIPALTGVDLPMYDLLQHAHEIPNFAGIKYTAPDLMDFRKCLTYGDGRYDILWGIDEMLISALAMGASGGVGSTYNYAAPLYLEMIDAFHQGDLDKARTLQSKSIDVVDVLVAHGGIAAGKYYMKHIGLDCGEFRLPVGKIADVQRFESDLARIGFDAFSSVLSEAI